MPAYYPSGATLDIDFTTSTLGGMTFARASGATDSLYTDAAGSSYNTFTNDQPRFSATWGLLNEPQARTNYLFNSAAPATQTTPSLAVANHALWVIGTGSATITAGTGVATGLGTATPGTPLLFSVTTAGTFTVTVTGSLNRFQLERGGSPTSFIVTAGAIGTRAAETCTLATGAWFSATAGTLLADFAMPFVGTNTTATGVVTIDDNTLNNRLTLAQNPNLQFIATTAGVSQVNTTVAMTVASNTTSRMAARYSSTDWRHAGNGTLGVTQIGKTFPTVTQLSFPIGATSQLGATFRIRRVTYWNTALSDSDLQVATTLQPAYASFNRPGPAWYFDTSDVLQQAANDTLRFGFVDPAAVTPAPIVELAPATNQIRNNTWVGGVGGSPGTLPTNVTFSATPGGLTRTLAFSTVNGMAVMDVTYVGTTSTGPTAIQAFFESSLSQIPTVNGQIWSVSVYGQLLSGAMPTTTKFLSLDLRDNVGTNLGAANYTSLVTLDGTLRRISTPPGTGLAVNNASATFVRPSYILASGIPTSTAVNVTFRLVLPQFEVGTVVSSPIPTLNVGSGVTRVADAGPVLGYTQVTAAAQQSYNVTGTALIGPMQLAGRLNEFHMAGTARMGPIQGSSQAQTEYRMATSPRLAMPAMRVSTSFLQEYQLTATAQMPAMRATSPLVYQGMVGRLLLALQASGIGAQEERSTGTGLMGPMRVSGVGMINYGFTGKLLLPALRAAGQMRRGYDLSATMRLPAMRAAGQFGQRINLSGRMVIGPMAASGGLLLSTPLVLLPPLLTMGGGSGTLFVGPPGTGASGQPPVAPWFPSVMSQGESTAPRILQQHLRGDATEELPDGINTMLMSYTATWDATFAQSDFLVGWLRTYVGNDIRWIVPGEATARFWRIKEWKRNTPEPDHDVITVTFEERPLP